jgi:hypothetical protein
MDYQRSSPVNQEDILKQAILPGPEPQAIEETVQRRAHQRISVSVAVEIVDATTGARITGRVTDLGGGGCYADTMNTFPKGTSVEVFLHWQERTLHLRALVAYAVNGKGIGMGLSFTGNSAEAGATLLDWMADLGGQLPSAGPQPDLERPTRGETKLARTHRLEEIMDDLVTLLMRKGVLTEAEATQLRDRISD